MSAAAWALAARRYSAEVVGRNCRLLQGSATDRRAVDRIIAAGGCVWRNPAIQVMYFPQPDFRSFIRKQIVHDALLFRSRPVCRDSELHLYIRKFFVGLFDTLPGNGPKVRRVVGHKGQFGLLLASA